MRPSSSNSKDSFIGSKREEGAESFQGLPKYLQAHLQDFSSFLFTPSFTLSNLATFKSEE
jgi:hypothetical protein